MSRNSHTFTIHKIYRSIDRKTNRLQRATGLHCPKECGACCETQQIETTVLELLPLAKAVFNNRQEDQILHAVEEKLLREDFSCALYRPDTNLAGNGECSYYQDRPLLCRLFGFAARKNRLGHLEFSTCRRIIQIAPECVQRANIALEAGLRVPVYQDSFMCIATLNPAIGFKRRPINLAIKEALEYVYWRRPGRNKIAKAS